MCFEPWPFHDHFKTVSTVLKHRATHLPTQPIYQKQKKKWNCSSLRPVLCSPTTLTSHHRTFDDWVQYWNVLKITPHLPTHLVMLIRFISLFTSSLIDWLIYLLIYRILQYYHLLPFLSLSIYLLPFYRLGSFCPILLWFDYYYYKCRTEMVAMAFVFFLSHLTFALVFYGLFQCL